MKLNKKLAATIAGAVVLGTVGVVSAVATTPSGDSGSSFHPAAPARIMDTRNGTGVAKGQIKGGKTVALQVTGKGGVPTDATGVDVNVTVVNATGNDYLEVYPAGTTRPNASSVNFHKGETVANDVPVKLSADGKLDVYVNKFAADVVVDVEGYYTAAVPGQDGAPGQNAVASVTTASALDADGTVLTHVGGAIATAGFATPLTNEVTLEPGTYEYTLYADFSRKAGTGSDNPAGNNTYGTAFLWADLNGDNAYEWKTGEALGGTVQTGAVPVDPTGSIEQPANGTGVFTLTKETKVRVGGFAYNTNTGNYGTDGGAGAGDFSFLGANASFIKLNVADAS